MGLFTCRYGSLASKTFKLFIKVLLSQVYTCTNSPQIGHTPKLEPNPKTNHSCPTATLPFGLPVPMSRLVALTGKPSSVAQVQRRNHCLPHLRKHSPVSINQCAPTHNPSLCPLPSKAQMFYLWARLFRREPSQTHILLPINHEP